MLSTDWRPPSRFDERIPAFASPRPRAPVPPSPAASRDTLRHTAPGSRAERGCARSSCLCPVCLILFILECPTGFEISRVDDPVGALVDGGEKFVAGNGLFQLGEVVDLGRLAGVCDDLVEVPPLGHIIQHFLYPSLCLGHVVRGNGQYRIVARLFLLLPEDLTYPLEPVRKGVGIRRSE